MFLFWLLATENIKKYQYIVQNITSRCRNNKHLWALIHNNT